MNKQNHLVMWDQMRLRHGILLRLLDQIPADKFTIHPIPGMRTPIELVVHMYTSMEAFADSVLTGLVGKFDEKLTAASIKTKDQLIAWVKKTWTIADKKAHDVTEAQLAAKVKTQWGQSFTGFAMFGILYDEYLHHRGQLFAFVRMFGIEPLSLWDYEHNAMEFKPRELAKS
jgi:uncharacterized damage-inducible protein DinB